MTAGIYAIINTANGRTYVGSSVNIERRWGGRQTELNRGKSTNKLLQNDWAATLGSGFEFRILEVTEASPAALIAAEQRWIEEYRPKGVYNQRGAHVGRHRSVPRKPSRGWGWVRGRRKWHYFIRNNVSLCQQAVAPYRPLFLEDDKHDSPQNCVACRRLRDAPPKRRGSAARTGEGE